MKLRIRPAARAELREHMLWLIERSPASARQAGLSILLALRQLTEFPESGAAIGSGLRKLVIGFGKDGFVAHYRVDEDRIMIERIIHGRQER